MSKERVLVVTGPRDYFNRQHISRLLDTITRDLGIERIIVGDAKGVDHITALWAKENNVDFEIVRADWNLHGKSAGPIRNTKMARRAASCEYSACLAFYRGEGTRGTRNMVQAAADAGISNVMIEQTVEPANE